MTVAELFLKESEKTKDQGAEVTDTINQFDKMDLYKSIFLSDSEEEIDNEDKSKNNEASDYIDKPKNVERNTSPPRGIFANIDFDELNSWRRKDDVPKPKEDSSKKDENVSNKVENTQRKDDDAMYGPKIPENLQKRLQSETQNNAKETIDINSSSSEDSWVDINEVSTKKHKKKKSKKHKSKHKKKSKSKKKDR
ncbi:hypothetical protein B5X24_HaOG216309 [Helicoverpa armigera]|uniref:Uncharacterized protein n=1 Tax=Helicoverpa armigera TaxID=29058 RepID=A0A2W1B202_HELAM|nr:hypothetical protein B5X24_HaOG216309 [Helicoverpa armigera]